jgi:uncharacterized membrane protein
MFLRKVIGSNSTLPVFRRVYNTLGGVSNLIIIIIIIIYLLTAIGLSPGGSTLLRSLTISKLLDGSFLVSRNKIA